MHLGHALTALLSFGSLAAAAPAVEYERDSSSRYRHKSRSVLSSSLVLQNQTRIETVNIGQLGAIGQLAQISQLSQLAQLAEAQLLAQVQSQVLLAAQLQTIKDNIRINTLKARFPQVNTVLVTVTNVIDARDPANINQRYLLNHLVIDNGFADKEQVVMATESQDMTITAEATATAAADATSTLDLGALLSSAAAAATPTSTLPLPLTQRRSQVISQQQRTVVTAFNPSVPLGFLNQSSQLLLPYDTAAPTNPLVVDDPANIIFAGNHHLLVESIGSLQADCLAFGLGGNAFLGGAANLALFGSVQQAVSAQLTTIQIGTRVQAIPPSVLLGHPDLAAALASAQASASATVGGETSSSSVSEATATSTM